MTVPARRVPTAPDATILPFFTTAAAKAGSSNRARIGSRIGLREAPTARRGVCADGALIGMASNATSATVAIRPLRNMDFPLMIECPSSIEAAASTMTHEKDRTTMIKMRTIVTLLIAALLASCRINDAGSGFGFQAAIFRDPKTGTTIAVLVNATPTPSPGRQLNFAPSPRWPTLSMRGEQST